jgi:hypothetical protein
VHHGKIAREMVHMHGLPCTDCSRSHPRQGRVLLEDGIGHFNRHVSLRCWPAILCYVEHGPAAACGTIMHCLASSGDREWQPATSQHALRLQHEAYQPTCVVGLQPAVGRGDGQVQAIRAECGERPAVGSRMWRHGFKSQDEMLHNWLALRGSSSWSSCRKYCSWRAMVVCEWHVQASMPTQSCDMTCKASLNSS